MSCRVIDQTGDPGPGPGRLEQTSIRAIPRHAHVSTTHVGTEIAAQLLLVEPQTLLKSHSQKGCYGPIRPVRLPSRKLAWPLAEIEKLLNGEGGAG